MLTRALHVVQITGETVGEVKAVSDMHQRKAEMARHSDAFIALPGWYKLNTTIAFIYIYISSKILRRNKLSLDINSFIKT